MNRFLRYTLPALIAVAAASPAAAQFPGDGINNNDAEITTYFDTAIFYDGYRTNEVIDAALDDGILRHTNYLYAMPLGDLEFDPARENLMLEVLIGAMCDNYDRMGRVNIAFVERGAKTYVPEAVERIELARFITPFMNMNRAPKVVPYVYEINDFAHILNDTELRERYDLWLETEVFGVPYAANQQIKGCEGHNDVFNATVSFARIPKSEEELAEAPATGSLLGEISKCVPIYYSKTELKGNVNLNNYNALATDTIGATTRTWEFELDSPQALDGELMLILTNHGAAENGEEYERRKHLVYFDDELAMVYTPGGISCEPYRKYNTQSNFIYGTLARDDYWYDWNNWCPGQAVPTRRIALGSVAPGKHKVMIRVPDAEFYGADGDFRPSLYFLGDSEKILPASVALTDAESYAVSFNREGDILHLNADIEPAEACIYTFDGQLVEGHFNPGLTISLSGLPAGAYIVVVSDSYGRTAYTKIII